VRLALRGVVIIEQPLFNGRLSNSFFQQITRGQRVFSASM
jgi:hypothetical protein